MKRMIAVAAFALATGVACAHDMSHPAHHSEPHDTAFGRAADPGKANRVARIEMRDQMRFAPAAITVKRGEIIRFVAVNKGRLMHEMVLGTMTDLKEHAALMRKSPDMHHDAPNMTHVPPGASGEFAWQFTDAGEFYFGCLVPGHFEAGMIGKVTVVP